MTTTDLDAYVPDDLPEWRDERLVSEAARIITELDDANIKLIRLNRAYHAIQHEQARRRGEVGLA